jgi:predicted DNA-binding ribbon-helix-helix protein
MLLDSDDRNPSGEARALERLLGGISSMTRKTMRIGEVRTSIKLEEEFWSYLKEIAEERRVRLSALVKEVACASPESTNLASTLRQYALRHARGSRSELRQRFQELSLAGGSQDLARVLEVCPMPSLLLDEDRVIRLVNRAFALWLNLDPKGTIGQRIENIMILRGAGMREMWSSLREGRLARGSFTATYVSPGKVRTSQALALAIGNGSHRAGNIGGFVVIFETLAGRS